MSDSYHSLMKHYASMDPRMMTLEDFDICKVKLEELAKQSLDINLFEPALKWLVTNDAKNGYEFGCSLGKADKSFGLLSIILQAQKNAIRDPSVHFLAGYFTVLFERDPAKWESELDSMLKDSILDKYVPEVVCWSGMTDWAGKQIISLIKEHNLEFGILHSFICRDTVKILSELVFVEWIEFLLDEEKFEAAIIALGLFHCYFIDGEPRQIPKELTLRLLLHKNIICRMPQSENYSSLESNWKEIGLQFVRKYPDKSIAVAETMLENFTDHTLFHQSGSEVLEVLDAVTKIKPSDVWKIVARYIRPLTDSRADRIKNWLSRELSGSESTVFELIPLEEMFRWIDEDSEKRAGYLVSYIPADFKIAREFLIRYGEREDVQRNLEFNFYNNTGPRYTSDINYYNAEKQKFYELLENEEEQKVKDWLKYYIRYIEEQLQKAIDEDGTGI